MPSPILARADALMQRRRNPNADLEDVPVLTDTVNGEEDFPVLHNIDVPPAIVEADVKTQAESGTIAEPAVPSARDYTLETGGRDIIAHELACRIEQRIIAELPRIIEAAVQDFLSEQKILASLQPRD